MRKCIYASATFMLILMTCPQSGLAQTNIVYKDSIVYKIAFRDTTIYQYNTVRINRYVHSDTIKLSSGVTQTPATTSVKKGLMNGNNWGVGPTAGAYYSPYNGFDINIGFGVQYFLFTLSGNRNPHMGHRRSKK